MADEKKKLLASPDDDLGYKNKGIISNDEEHDLSFALKIIKEQGDLLKTMQNDMDEQRSVNAKLSSKLEDLTRDIQILNDSHSKETIKKDEQIDKLKNTLEAKTEFQASLIDELRYQIQSMRNKMDSKRLTENGTSSGKAIVKHNEILSPTKKLLRNNSEDSISSNGSNPCLLSRTIGPQRAEYVWRINAFTKKLKRIQSNSYDDPSRSEPFVTGPNGYRLSMWAYLNGRGKGFDKCLAVYVRIMAGEYDPVLPWPIKPCYTFQLISQAQDPNKRLDLVRVRDLSVKHSGISRPQKDDKSIIVGFDDFIVHEDLEKKEYLADDSLFIKCIVEI